MEKTIDARGLSCPQPVVLAKKTIDKGVKEFKVLVDSEVSKENIMRMGKKNSYDVEEKKEGEDISVIFKKKNL